MAMPTTTPADAAAPSAQMVGNAFVDQYYHILHTSPKLVFRFYHDSSVLSRQEPNGAMTSVTTMQAINDKILSLDYTDFKAEIKSVDSQVSYKGGVVVLVTGCLTGKDNLRREFTQSFFLAPQDKGYFVLNDVFRYVDENVATEATPVAINSITESAASAAPIPNPEPANVSEEYAIDSATLLVERSCDNGEEVCDPSDNEGGSVVDVEVVAPSADTIQNHNEAPPITESASPTPPDDAPKKSYASIVKVSKGKTVPAPVYVPTNRVRVKPVSSVQQSAPAPGPEVSSPSSNNIPESSDNHVEVEGHSIYIRSLPMNATVPQVEEEFKRFGPIKPNGIQVRSNKVGGYIVFHHNKQQAYCFGFVEFESSSSMIDAVKAASVTMEGRQVYIEEKKTTSRAGSGRGRYPPAKGGLQNDNFRGRGNFNSGRGYGRNDFGYGGEPSGRGRGPSGRSGEGYQRYNQGGSGKLAVRVGLARLQFNETD